MAGAGAACKPFLELHSRTAMEYTFYVGITITSPAAYNSLSEEQRERARVQLLDLVRPVADVMGRFETAQPEAFIRARVAGVQGGAWSVGAVIDSGFHYYWNPVEGCWICVRNYGVDYEGTQYVRSVTVDGTVINSTFVIFQTAQNP
jgi:hypothetical protein